MPFLRSIYFDRQRIEEQERRSFPYNIPAIQGIGELKLTSDVTFFLGGLRQIRYEETDHYTLTKDFLNNRERYFRVLFDDD